MKKIIPFGGVIATLALFFTFFVVQANAATTWNTTGDYVVNMNYLGTDYSHDMSLVQDSLGNLTGNGGSPAGSSTYTWVINSGTVDGDSINFTANYTATADAVTPQTVLTVAGIIAEDGTISGTWSDNYAGGERAGTLSTVSGSATTTETATASSTVKVTIQKYVDGTMATASSSNNSDFPMSATWNAENIGAGTGEYVLSETGYNGNPTPYQAMTTDMTSGADYSTSEITTTEVVGTSCTVPGTDYALIGYAYGDTLEQAQMATSSLVAPSFTNMTTDKFVIVLNDNCATTNVGGQITGEVATSTGMLAVTSIEMTDSTATANNSFEDGWEYVFNITIPTDETDVSMKFADWMRTGGTETIPAGGNMRISSPQANNAGATIMITSANMYSTPALTMTNDLNPSLDGMQVRVIVEVKVPTGTTNGSYTTNYGLKSE
jgi:hypothetical protein